MAGPLVTIETPDISPSLRETDVSTEDYEEYSVEVKYVYDAGRLQIPVADDKNTDNPPEAEIIRTNAPTSKKVVIFSIAKAGSLPQMPSPVSASRNEVLLEAVINIHLPTVKASLTPSYRVTGYIVWALKKPVWLLKDSVVIPKGVFNANLPSLSIGPKNFTIKV